MSQTDLENQKKIKKKNNDRMRENKIQSDQIKDLRGKKQSNSEYLSGLTNLSKSSYEFIQTIKKNYSQP